MRGRAEHGGRVLAVVALGTLALAAVALATPGATVTVNDGNDTPVLLDIRQASLAQPGTSRLLARVTTYDPWESAYLLAPTGPPGSICLELWTKHKPGSESPDFLVCATARSNGTPSAAVLREGAGPPRKVGSATATRPNARTIAISFAPRLIGTPARLRFATEVIQAIGCPRPHGCVDRAPGGTGTRLFELRR